MSPVRGLVEEQGGAVQADEVLVHFDHVYKIYRTADTGVAALGDVTFEIRRGEFVALVGPSGAGKSSILNLIGGLDRATAGEVRVHGQDLGQLDDVDMTLYRRNDVGFVWQGTARNLVPYLPLHRNVELPLLATGKAGRGRDQRVADLLRLVDLSERAAHLPWMLSGGEQQRAAIAVALANLPPLILADEPTAELDSASANLVLAAFRAACREFRTTIVMVTHDLLAAERADRTMRLLDGRIRHEARPAQLEGGRVTLPRDAVDALASEDGELQVEVSEGEVHLRRKRGRNG